MNYINFQIYRNILTLESKKYFTDGVKNLRSRNLLKAIITIIMLIGIGGIALSNSLLSSITTIKSIGQISTKTVWARSGSAEDIQAAVNTVATTGGGTVYVPAGTFYYTPSVFSQQGIGEWRPAIKVPGGVNIIGAGINQTILVQTEEVNGGCFFEIDGRNGKPVRISGFYIKGYVTTETKDCCAIAIFSTKDFRIDHCRIEDFSGFGIQTVWTSSSYIHRGVIDHCIIDNPYKEQPGTWDWAYGIGVFGDDYTWMSLNDLLGQYNNNIVYIEDCFFARCRYAVTVNTGGFAVVRHNTITVSKLYDSFGKAGLDTHAHGGDIGARGLEVYNNIILRGGDYADTGVLMRCGGGVVFNNTFLNVDRGIWVLKQSGLPEDEQHIVSNFYIWNNSYQNVVTPFEADSYYQENVHYSLYAKPGYTPYPYPHPLTQLQG